jgi:pseudouridine synthase
MNVIPQKLEKVLAHRGIASRRDAKKIIEGGFVQVNNQTVRIPSTLVTEHDVITVSDEVSEQYETYLIYKPRGIETTKTVATHQDIHDIFADLAHLSPIGRLDKESEGLILLSNDGVLAKVMTQRPSIIEKEYLVSTQETIVPAQIEKMSRGIMIDGTPTLPAKVIKKSAHEFSIILHEGRKHQVRRMASAVGLTITRLVRIRIGHLITEPQAKKFAKRLKGEEIARMKKTA